MKHYRGGGVSVKQQGSFSQLDQSSPITGTFVVTADKAL